MVRGSEPQDLRGVSLFVTLRCSPFFGAQFLRVACYRSSRACRTSALTSYRPLPFRSARLRHLYAIAHTTARGAVFPSARSSKELLRREIVVVLRGRGGGLPSQCHRGQRAHISFYHRSHAVVTRRHSNSWLKGYGETPLRVDPRRSRRSLCAVWDDLSVSSGLTASNGGIAAVRSFSLRATRMVAGVRAGKTLTTQASQPFATSVESLTPFSMLTWRTSFSTHTFSFFARGAYARLRRRYLIARSPTRAWPRVQISSLNAR